MSEDQQVPDTNQNHIPPPVADITIRTLSSDMSSLAQSGGSHPQSQMVALNRVPAQTPTLSATATPKNKSIVTLAIAVVIILIIIATYFAITL